MRRGSREDLARDHRAACPAGCRYLGRGAAARAAPETESPHRSHGPHSARRASTEWRLGRDCASRVDDMAEAPYATSLSSVPKGRTLGGARTGSPVRVSARGVRRCFGPNQSQEPFTRLGGGGLGPRVRPGGRALERACASAGRRRWTQLRSAGEARGATEHQRYVGRTAAGEDNAPPRSVGSPKWARRREPRALASRGDVRCDVHRDLGSHL